MCKDPIDPRVLEEAGQLGLFTHEPEPVEEVLLEVCYVCGIESCIGCEDLSSERVEAGLPPYPRHPTVQPVDREELEEEDLEHLVTDRCREELEEELYRARVLAWHPELEEEDLEDEEEEDLEELEDIDELRERVELLERTGDFESAAVLAALETGIPVSATGLKLTRFSPRARAKVLSRLLNTIGEVRVVLEAEGLIPPDSEPETVHDLIHGRGDK